MNSDRRDIYRAFFNVMIVTICTVGVIAAVFFPNSMGITKGANAFRYFTVDGSILCGVAAAISLICRSFGIRQNNKIFFLKYTSAVSASVIFIGAMMLVPIMGRGLIMEFDMFLLHIINPFLCVISFILFEERRLEFRIEPIWLSLIPLLIYGIVVIVLCLTKVWTGDGIPYPILDFYNNNMFLSIFAIVLIAAIAAVMAYALDKFNMYFDEKLDDWSSM